MDKEFAIDGNEALEELVDSANGREEHVVLTRAGKPVGAIIVKQVFDPEAARAAFEWMRSQPKIDLGMPIKDAINWGPKASPSCLSAVSAS